MTGDLRSRKKLAAMKRVQRHALQMFLERGFDEVTVEQIAHEADVASASVYRYFGTKEGIVIWDEYDPPIVEEITRRLGLQPPLRAIRDGLVSVADQMYDPSHDLERIQLIHRVPELRAAAEDNSRAIGNMLVSLLTDPPASMDRFHADVVARAIVGVLTAAIDEWQRTNGDRPLTEILLTAFAALDRATNP